MIRRSVVFALYLFLVLTSVFYQAGARKDAQIGQFEFFSVIDNHNRSSHSVWDGNLFGLPISFFTVALLSSPLPFSVNVRLEPTSRYNVKNPNLETTQRALWLYTSESYDQANLQIKINNNQIVEIDNRLSNRPKKPVAALKYIADIDAGHDPIELTITSPDNQIEQNLIEMGLFVLAPQSASKDEIQSLINQIGEGQVFGLGSLLLIISLSFMALVYFIRSTPFYIRSVNLNNIYSGIVLICLSAVSFYAYCYEFPSVPVYATQDIGVTKPTPGFYFGSYVNRQFEKTMGSINEFQKSVLPSQVVVDDVPVRLWKDSGTFATNIYYQNKPHGSSLISKNVWGGWLDTIRFMSGQYFIVSIIVLMSLILYTIFVRFFFPTRHRAVFACLVIISLLSCFLSIRLSDVWDEVFVNLRHSYMLIHHGMFSINANQWIEATVETLPLLITAFFGFVGFDLLDTYLAVVLSGNVLLICTAFIFVRKLTSSPVWALISAALIGLYPNVLWVGTTGFAAVPFTTTYIAASYFLLFSNRKNLGLILLASLTLVRTEGILFAALLMAYTHVLRPLTPAIRSRNFKSYVYKMGVEGFAVASPFLLMTVFRSVIYGYTLPIPIFFKNTGFDRGYFEKGINTFTNVAIMHGLPLMVVGIVFLGCLYVLSNLIFKRRIFSSVGMDLMALNLITFLAIVPYYIGGSDWFPGYWNRYGMPLNIVLLLTFLTVFYRTFSGVLQLENSRRWFPIIILPVFFFSFASIHSQTIRHYGAKYAQKYLHGLRAMPKVGWDRVDNLNILGRILNQTLPKNAVVSSPEEATIMYYAEREMLGLLGVSNPEIIFMPLQSMAGEGDIMQRKRGYLSVYKNRPSVILFFDPVIAISVKDNPQTQTDIRDTVTKSLFTPWRATLAYYRAGSMDALKKMGYRHMSIAYSNMIFSMFIHDKIYDSFVDNLTKLGFNYLGEEKIPYKIDSEIVKRYLPAAPEMIPEL